jgi:endonuclease/exonuclease/phosphatase family metal-dependent hydrolase
VALRLATFNLENLDDVPGAAPTLAQRIAILRPQLNRVLADMLCLQEINSQGPSGARTLAALDSLIAGTRYQSFHRATTRTVSGQLYDVRNLVLLSAFPISNTRIIRENHGPRPSYQLATAVPPDVAANVVQWERPILHVEIDIGLGRTLHVLNLHLKSKIATDIPGQKLDEYTWRTPAGWAEGSFVSSMKRMGQALQTRLAVDAIFDAEGTTALIAVCGDFNSDHDDVPMRAICGMVEDTGNPAHGPRVLVPCETNVPEPSRFSLFHLGKGEMLDHVVVSRGLLEFFDHAEVHNEVLPDESGAFRTDVNFPESDHAPVVAEFRLP